MLEVTLSSCTKCPDCELVVYDEDIIAGWKVRRREGYGRITVVGEMKWVERNAHFTRGLPNKGE